MYMVHGAHFLRICVDKHCASLHCTVHVILSLKMPILKRVNLTYVNNAVFGAVTLWRLSECAWNLVSNNFYSNYFHIRNKKICTFKMCLKGEPTKMFVMSLNDKLGLN
jgi:hypothetical protein